MSGWTEYDWHDVTPQELPEVPGHVAQIAYSDEFRKAISLFRACTARNETSSRVLALTRAIIEMNPAHYSVWDYRFKVAQKIGNQCFDYKQIGLTPKAPSPPVVGEDGDWLNNFTLSHSKNYQIWNYRQHLIDPQNPLWFRGERVITSLVFEDDPKNFHAWSHLKWVISQSIKAGSDAFGDASSLLKDCDDKLLKDVWNNSLWSFRYFLYSQFPQLLNADLELQFVVTKLKEAPQNESAWNYIRGFVADLDPTSTDKVEDVARSFPNEPRAIELLGELDNDNSSKYWDKLSEMEPLRRPFWEARKAGLA